MKKLFKLVTSRAVVTGLLIFLQVSVLVLGIVFLSSYFFYVNILFSFISFLIVFYIVWKKDNPAYKLAWIIPILLFPAVGGILYFIFAKRNIAPASRKRMDQIRENNDVILQQSASIMERLKASSTSAFRQASYIRTVSGSPVCQNTYTRFLTPGEEKFAFLLEELKKAKRFIFLEYFIIEEGTMWNTVLDILIEKVRDGVEVRLLYDDMGTINLLPPKYDQKIRQYGIQTEVFNPFRPSLDVFMNYRDHRKIAVIDGNVGFTGGINLADEYINAYPKHGHWKDSSLLLKGDGVWNLTVMFLNMWEYCTGVKQEYQRYRPTESYGGLGYVQPFCDNPADDRLVGEMAYINMINQAKRCIYIATPYLILDNEMVTALTLAAESGVDVRIVTPHIADKWYVHEVTRSNYPQLLENGVKIYEYTPGFIHAKTMVVDDEFAFVGTTNFDFRSFYLHYECGIWMYQANAIPEVLEDYRHILEVSERVTLEDCQNIPLWRKIGRAALNLLAPLM